MTKGVPSECRYVSDLPPPVLFARYQKLAKLFYLEARSLRVDRGLYKNDTHPMIASVRAVLGGGRITAVLKRRAFISERQKFYDDARLDKDKLLELDDEVRLSLLEHQNFVP